MRPTVLGRAALLVVTFALTPWTVATCLRVSTERILAPFARSRIERFAQVSR